jgi:hypothetical protein
MDRDRHIESKPPGPRNDLLSAELRVNSLGLNNASSAVLDAWQSIVSTADSDSTMPTPAKWKGAIAACTRQSGASRRTTAAGNGAGHGSANQGL